jgi:hypothetical protein
MSHYYQVYCTDSRDYIDNFENFGPKEIGNMLKYINRMVTIPSITKIVVKKWDGDKPSSRGK